MTEREALLAAVVARYESNVQLLEAEVVSLRQQLVAAHQRIAEQAPEATPE